MRVGMIGLGNMGSAIAQCLRETVASEDLLLSNRSPQKVVDFIKAYGGCAASSQEVFECADVIFLAVKPYQMETLIAEHSTFLAARQSVLVVSMAASITLDQLCQWLPKQAHVIRMMPNTPVAIGQGVVTYAVSDNCDTKDQDTFKHLLAQAGTLVALDEKLIDASTALSGCGPAFVYLFIEALSDAGVSMGLSRADSLLLASQTVAGSAKMVKETNEHPGVLKDQVTSPGGATIAGIASLEKEAFRGSVISAVLAAFDQSKNL